MYLKSERKKNKPLDREIEEKKTIMGKLRITSVKIQVEI